jgi:hypothetical protein
VPDTCRRLRRQTETAGRGMCAGGRVLAGRLSAVAQPNRSQSTMVGDLRHPPIRCVLKPMAGMVLRESPQRRHGIALMLKRVSIDEDVIEARGPVAHRPPIAIRSQCISARLAPAEARADLLDPAAASRRLRSQQMDGMAAYRGGLRSHSRHRTVFVCGRLRCNLVTP